MTVYSYSQLEQLWINAGGPRALAPLMAAIAEAESSGNSDALNTTDNNGTQTSVGLWQVSTGTHNYPQSWLTAAGNAAEAVAKYQSQGLGAWGTYVSGAYKQFLQGGTAPSGTVPAGSGSSGGGSSGGGGSDATLTAAEQSSGYLSYDTDSPSSGIETTSFLGSVFSTIIDPFKAIEDAGRSIAAFFSEPEVGLLEVIKTAVTALGSLTNGIDKIIHDLLWLFNPSHWVRIFCFLLGVFVAIPALYSLMHTGRSDLALAMGIFLTVAAAILFFLAFHNLPYAGTGAPASSSNVINLQSLLAYITSNVTGTSSGASISTAAATQSTGSSGTSSPLGFGSGGGTGFVPVQNATGDFPVISNISPTPSGNPPISDIFTGSGF